MEDLTYLQKEFNRVRNADLFIAMNISRIDRLLQCPDGLKGFKCELRQNQGGEELMVVQRSNQEIGIEGGGRIILLQA